MSRGVVRSALAAAALALVGLSGVALASPASAHASLVRVVPGDGSTVTTAPTTVRLVFDEAVASPAAVVVRGPSGRVDRGDAQPVDDQVTVRVDIAPRPSDVGRYTVAFRVVSADGHPVSGEATFEYRPPGITAAPAGDSTREPASQSGGSHVVLLGGLAAAVVLALLLLLLPRMRR